MGKRKYSQTTGSIPRIDTFFPKKLKYADNPFLAALGNLAANTLATGFDETVTATGTKTRTPVRSSANLAQGWQVGFIHGLKKKFPKYLQPIWHSQGQQVESYQEERVTNTILNRVANDLIIENWPLSYIQTKTDLNARTVVTNSHWKVMWTNLSNIKICYEFYYVTPKVQMANRFDVSLHAQSNVVDLSTGNFDVMTIFKPETVPAVRDNWRILAKRVFRLNPGETAELHGKDNIYKKLDESEQGEGRTYIPGINTQLYVRWYGQPCAQGTTPTTMAEGTIGDDNCKTAWIIERTLGCIKVDINNPTYTSWSTTIPALIGGNTVYTHAENDIEVTAAD